MKHWNVAELEGLPGPPRILSSTDETRAIALGLAAGATLDEHEVHERAWVVVVAGELRFELADGTGVDAGPGALFELEPHERHAVRARTDTRFLLLLAPWPGRGHPGAMTLDEKRGAREHAAEHEAGRGADPSA
ncbi:cupin domain-containing protein [Patulibacter sp. S7RM1-6]